MKQETKPEFSHGHVSGTALGDLQLLRDAMQVSKYIAWDMKLDSPGGIKALEIMDEFHSGKYGSKDGIWVQAKNALDALEKLLQQGINPEPENTGNQDQTTFDDSYLSDNIVEARTDHDKAVEVYRNYVGSAETSEERLRRINAFRCGGW